MQKYLLVLNQGGGCDYTIACGIKTIVLEYPENLSMEEVQERVKKEVFLADGYGYLRSGSSEEIQESVLYKISESVNLPLGNWKTELESEKKAQKNKEQEEKEKELYLKMKAKYG